MLIGFIILVVVILATQWLVWRANIGSTAKSAISTVLWGVVVCGLAGLYLAAGMPG